VTRDILRGGTWKRECERVEEKVKNTSMAFPSSRGEGGEGEQSVCRGRRKNAEYMLRVMLLKTSKV
jgi:hypothetical protein